MPVGLRSLIADHDAFTVEYQDWKGMMNGRLLAAAEKAGFDIFVTADRNLRFQQHTVGLKIAIVTLAPATWLVIKNAIGSIRTAIVQARVGHVALVEIPDAGSRRTVRS